MSNYTVSDFDNNNNVLLRPSNRKYNIKPPRLSRMSSGINTPRHNSNEMLIDRNSPTIFECLCDSDGEPISPIIQDNQASITLPYEQVTRFNINNNDNLLKSKTSSSLEDRIRAYTPTMFTISSGTAPVREHSRSLSSVSSFSSTVDRSVRPLNRVSNIHDLTTDSNYHVSSFNVTQDTNYTYLFFDN